MTQGELWSERMRACEHAQHGVLTERSAGSVSIPQEAFIAALRMGDEG